MSFNDGGNGFDGRGHDVGVLVGDPFEECGYSHDVHKVCRLIVCFWLLCDLTFGKLLVEIFADQSTKLTNFIRGI